MGDIGSKGHKEWEIQGGEIWGVGNVKRKNGKYREGGKHREWETEKIGDIE